MTTIVSRKNDQSRHAAAIERWDNEGGASSQDPEREAIEKALKHRRSVSANRDEQEGS
jgi:hypothetical protein